MKWGKNLIAYEVMIYVFALIALVVIKVPSDCGGLPHRGNAQAAGKDVPLMGVDALMKNPEKYKGPLLVEGVVSAIYPDMLLFGLIDIAEYKKCGVVTCATQVLPVRWEKDMPGVKELVYVHGEIRQEDDKMFFKADAVEKREIANGEKK